MSKEMNTNETIIELDKISSLYNRYQELNNSLNNLDNEQEDEKTAKFIETKRKLHEFKKEQDKRFGTQKPTINPDCMKLPPDPPAGPDSSNPILDIFIGALSQFLLIFSVALWIILVVLNPENKAGGLIAFSVILIIASIVFWLIKGSTTLSSYLEWDEEQKEMKVKQAEWENNFNKCATKEETNRFLAEFKEYDSRFLELVDNCSKKYDEEDKLFVSSWN